MHLSCKSLRLKVILNKTSFLHHATEDILLSYIATVLRTPRRLSAKRPQHPLVGSNTALKLSLEQCLTKTEFIVLVKASTKFPRTTPEEIVDLYAKLVIQISTSHSSRARTNLVSNALLSSGLTEFKDTKKKIAKTHDQHDASGFTDSLNIEFSANIIPKSCGNIQLPDSSLIQSDPNQQTVEPQVIIIEDSINPLDTSSELLTESQEPLKADNSLSKSKTEHLKEAFSKNTSLANQSLRLNVNRCKTRASIFQGSEPKKQLKVSWANPSSRKDYSLPEEVEFVSDIHQLASQEETKHTIAAPPIQTTLYHLSNIKSLNFLAENSTPRIDFGEAFGNVHSLRFIGCKMGVFKWKSSEKSANFVIKLTILDNGGVILFNEVMNPWHLHKQDIVYNDWYCAQHIHKITYDQVRSAPSPSHFFSVVKSLLENSILIGFDLDSDLRALEKTDFILKPFKCIDISAIGQFRDPDTDEKIDLQFLCEKFCLGLPDHDPVKEARAIALLYFMASTNGWI